MHLIIIKKVPAVFECLFCNSAGMVLNWRLTERLKDNSAELGGFVRYFTC